MKKRALSLLLILVLVVSTLYVRPVNAGQSKGIEEYREVLASVESSGELPAKFDLRDYGLVTPVRRQKYGTCWAYAVTAALETNVLINGYGNYDLSERYLAWCAKHVIDTKDDMIAEEGVSTSREDWYSNGSATAAAYTIMNGYGVALEETYPFKNIEKDIPEEELGKDILKCTGAFKIPSEDIEAVKRSLVKHGGVYLRTWWSNDTKVFKSKNRNYIFYMSDEFYSKNKNKINSGHVMAIIGWDDNYSKSNFATTPPGDGAWICKDSGGCGYIYISYHNYIDSNRDKYRYTFELEPLDTYDFLYTYDGGIGETEVENTNDIAIAFKANKDETLTGVAIKLVGETTATIKVYNNTANVDNISESNCIHVETVSLIENGYQTLQFSEGVNVSANDNIFVTVHFSNPVIYYVDNYWRESDMSNHASANPNETFIKKDNGNWEDLVNYGKANACIKVLARNGHNRRPLTLNNSHLTISNSKEATIDLTWKEVEGATTYEIYRKAEGEWNYTLVKTVGSTTFKYSDTKLTLGKKYTYKVIPVNGNHEGFSDEKTLTATIAATWIKKLDNSKSGKITITINKTKSAKSYSVYRYTGKEYKWIGNTATGTFVDKNVKSGTSYTYKVTANKGDLKSAYSAAKSVKAK